MDDPQPPFDWVILFLCVFIATVIGTLQKGYVTAQEVDGRYPDQEENNWITGISVLCFVLSLYALSKQTLPYASWFGIFFSTVLFQYSVTDRSKFDSPWLILGLTVVVSMLLIYAWSTPYTGGQGTTGYTVSIVTFVLLGTLFSSVATIVERKIITSQAGTGFWEWSWVLSQLVYMAFSFALLLMGNTKIFNTASIYAALFLCAASIAIVPVYPTIGKSALQLWIGEDAINKTTPLVYINTILTWAVTFRIFVIHMKMERLQEKINKISNMKDELRRLRRLIRD